MIDEIYNDGARQVLATSLQTGGGAPFVYQVRGLDHGLLRQAFVFQFAPIPKKGVEGVTNECLLAMVLHRLKCFQAGPCPCEENDRAIEHVAAALGYLEARTLDRKARGVEGQTVR